MITPDDNYDYQNTSVYLDFYGQIPAPRPNEFEQWLKQERIARYVLAKPYLAHMEALSDPAYIDELARRFYS